MRLFYDDNLVRVLSTLDAWTVFFSVVWKISAVATELLPSSAKTFE